jgi:hypothetical protein
VTGGDRCDRCGQAGAVPSFVCEHCALSELLCGGCSGRLRSGLCGWCDFALAAAP